MDNVNIKLHYYQVELVKRLSLKTTTRFNDLLIEGLESEHMNYHLKKLMDLGLVIKQSARYVLTNAGKDYSNLLDEMTDLIEKQPKTSVIVHAKRRNSKREVEHLLAKRLRHPYFGKVGHLTGKVKFGETLRQAAARELFEETGLEAKNYYLERVYHKMRSKDGEWVQDVIFYIFLATKISGKLITKTAYQENFWITYNGLKKRKDLDLYDDFSLQDSLTPQPFSYTEDKGEAKGY